MKFSFDPDSFSFPLRYGEFSDIYLEESSTLSLRWEDGKIEDITQGRNSGVGLRYIAGEETRYGFVDCARPLTGVPSSGEWVHLKDLSQNISSGLKRKSLSSLKPISQSPEGSCPKISFDSMSLKEKVGRLENAYRAATVSPSIRQVTLTYSEKIKRIGYLNSLGESFIEERPYRIFAAFVTASQNGLIQTALEVISGDFQDVEGIARCAAQRSLEKLKAPPAPLGEMPVVIGSSAGGTLIHEAIGHSLEADAVLEGTSPAFAGKIGEKVANPKVNVVDDPTVPSARGSFEFDDEGIPSQKTVLVENGILRTYLYDRLSAGRSKTVSNGHGRRESYASRPIPRMSNTFVMPGSDDPEEILGSLKKGFYVTKMGGGQVNTATGDFMFEVEEGFWVEKGQVKNMVKGANLLGNGPKVLRSIDMVGSDMGWGIGTCGKEGQGVPVSDGLPTIRIPQLIIGGSR